MPRGTKIVATLGPASDDSTTIKALISAGLNVARLNFSHGDHASHLATMERLRRAGRDLDRNVAVLQDLAGPKIRLGTLPDEGVALMPEEEVVLVSGEEAKPPELPVNYPYLDEDLAPGERILLADGLVELMVEAIEDGKVRCRVIVGGTLSSHKGVNLPGSSLRVPALTPKDEADLAFGLANGVDFVALSFVRHEDDLKRVREQINRADIDSPPLLIVKVEKPQAVDRLPQILAEADGVMVARGDLAVEMHLEEVPLVQKRIIRLARSEGKPVITATQMLRSMVNNPRPTRAEANDVVGAVLDGTDAVMLSEESAVGEYPVEAVAMLDRLTRSAENSQDFKTLGLNRGQELVPATEGAISRAVMELAEDLPAKAIVAATTSGSTARLVSRFRPPRPIIALTPDESTFRQLALSWGVIPVKVEPYTHTDQIFAWAEKAALLLGLALKGDRLVVTAGVPVGVPGTTNLIKVLDVS